MTPKKWKNWPQKLLIIGPDPFISQSSPDHSPELIFQIMKSRDQTSVLWSMQSALLIFRSSYGSDIHNDNWSWHCITSWKKNPYVGEFQYIFWLQSFHFIRYWIPKLTNLKQILFINLFEISCQNNLVGQKIRKYKIRN